MRWQEQGPGAWRRKKQNQEQPRCGTCRWWLPLLQGETGTCLCPHFVVQGMRTNKNSGRGCGRWKKKDPPAGGTAPAVLTPAPSAEEKRYDDARSGQRRLREPRWREFARL